MLSFTTQLKNYQSKIEKNLATFFPASSSRAAQAAHYSVFAGGKRLRPLLLILTYENLANRLAPRDLYRLAASFEYAHTFSLIHDDLPALDNDDFRRARPTCHRQFDEATAILAGDYLLALSLANLTPTKFSPSLKTQLIQILATAIGQVITGEMLDLEGEKRLLTPPELTATYQQKTAALFQAVFQSAFLAASWSQPSHIKVAQTLGKQLGLAFQIQDDVLGAIGDSAKLGKTVGLDEQANKSTWVKLYGLPQAEKAFQNFYHQARALIQEKFPPHENREFLLNLLLQMQNRDH